MKVCSNSNMFNKFGEERVYMSETVTIDNTVYCAYCGKKIEPYKNYNGSQTSKVYRCDCEDAVNEIKLYDEKKKLEDEMKELASQLPKPKYYHENVYTEDDRLVIVEESNKIFIAKESK